MIGIYNYLEGWRLNYSTIPQGQKNRSLCSSVTTTLPACQVESGEALRQADGIQGHH